MSYVDTTADTSSSGSTTDSGVTTTTTTGKRTYIRTHIDYVPDADPAFLWHVSDNGRYLQDRNDNPVLLISVSPQGMLVAASTTDMDTYLSARAGQGFNSVQVHVIAGATFGGGANFETYDNIHPFTSDGDISTPNNTYFNRLDTLLTTAAGYDIVVFLDAAEAIDALALWKTNGEVACYAWGQYLGSRYKDYGNIVWIVGNDFQTWTTDQAGVDCLVQVMQGIKNQDTNHLHTVWLDYYVSASRDSADFDAETTLDLGYTYYIAYDKIKDEYDLSPAKPVFLGEGYYEGITTLDVAGTPLILRKQNYWSMLAGACGIAYMNGDWAFPAGWADNLATAGATQIAYFKALFEAYNWWLLVPDIDTHDIVTAGYGTRATGTVLPDANEFAACAYIAGSLAIIYMSASLTMTVDMTQFSGTVTARWFDPTNGAYTADAASPLANTGAHDFSRAGANSANDHDWILVLEV